MVAILPYTKMPDTDEITFQKGDIFFVHNDLGDGWLWVTAHRCQSPCCTNPLLPLPAPCLLRYSCVCRTGEQGLVFKDLLCDLEESIDPNAVFPWFHRNLSKNEVAILTDTILTYTILTNTILTYTILIETLSSRTISSPTLSLSTLSSSTVSLLRGKVKRT